MNTYIDAQITNMITMARTFEQSCKMAALKNDGTIDRDEEAILKKINAATEKFIKHLAALQ